VRRTHDNIYNLYVLDCSQEKYTPWNEVEVYLTYKDVDLANKRIQKPEEKSNPVGN
jgi:hypothetical protein